MPKRSWTVGSNSSCDLVVDNVTVSGTHCRLTQEGDCFSLEDLESSNGTYVNGQRIDCVTKVTPSDRITLGQSQQMPWPGDRKDPGSQVITIGRASKNALVIDEPNVSSVHAQLTISGQSIVIEDLGSTNGTSVNSVENKINRANVKQSDKIFLGSRPYLVGDLIARASSSGAELRTETPAIEKEVPSRSRSVKTQPASGPASNSILLMGMGAVALAALAILLWAIWPDGGENPPIGELANSANKDRAVNSAEEGAGQLRSEESPPATENDASDSTPAVVAPLSESEKLGQSLFLIVCADQNRDLHFRVGTAFAIDRNRVATSASAITILEDLQDNGFPDVYLYQPASKREIAIGPTHVHPRYDAATENARRAQEEHDRMIDDLESQPPSPESFEAIKERLLAERIKAIDSLELKTTCDVGVIEVQQPLDYWLEGIDSTDSIRPKLKLDVSGYAFDLEDPYLDLKSSFKFSTMPGRVTTLLAGAETNSSPQRLEVSGTNDQLEYAYLGSPVMNDQGLVVAIYSRPVPAVIPPGESSESTPPEPTVKFDAALFTRVQECLENRP